MSFILDAIKKSEDERQRSKQPDVYSLQNMGVRTSTPRGKAIKLVVLCTALGLLVFIFSWLWPQLSAEFMSSISTAGHTNTGQGNNSGTTPQHSGAVPANVTTQVPQNPAAGSPIAPLSGSMPAPASTNPNGSGVLFYGSDAELPPRHKLKELWQMPADYQSTVPDLKFSFHVFSKNPDKRTIIINGRRMREGQMITSQLKLRAITETGVICHYQGRFFHVDVVEKW